MGFCVAEICECGLYASVYGKQVSAEFDRIGF